MQIGQAIRAAVTAAAKDWTTIQRKRLKDAARGARAAERYYRGRVAESSIKVLAFTVMKEAYLTASGGGRLPARARQVMYAARPYIISHMEKELGKDFDQYFCQTLLPEYMRTYPNETATWDVIFDARGHFTEPHTQLEVALGTLEVRKYLADQQRAVPKADALYSVAALAYPFPTVGPTRRYRTVLFVEKEGFKEIFAAAQLEERFDLAMMSTKGLSNTAGRTLIDQLTGVRFLVLHDFDVYGFSIIGTLRRDTDRYHFRHRPMIVDLGLRLADVEMEDLEPEPVTYRRRPSEGTLQQNGATADEIEFLMGDGTEGQRVELNALPSDRLIAWLERKLAQHGVEKLIPDEATLATAYRRAVYCVAVNEKLAKLQPPERRKADRVSVPAGLADEVQRLLQDDPALSWDAAVAAIAAVGRAGDHRQRTRGANHP